MAVNFYIGNKTDKKGDAPIRISISIKGTRLITSIGVKIAPNKWDNTKQRVKKGCSNSNGMTYVEINKRLLEISQHFTTYENQFILSKAKPTTSQIKSEFSRNFGKDGNKDSNKDFYKTFELFLNESGEKNQWALATRQRFSTLKKHLSKWKNNLSFEQFDDTGLISFVVFLRDIEYLRNSTIIAQLKLLKRYLRWAKSKGYHDNVAFTTFSPKLKMANKIVIFLEWTELMKVFNYVVPPNGTIVKINEHHGNEYEKVIHNSTKLNHIKNMFCFSCFTSLRYSDVVNLKHSNICDGYISITTIKTSDTLKIEINKFAQSILDKYPKTTSDKVFPHICIQQMDLLLKDLCELCGINQPITQTYYRGNERIEETLPKYALISSHTGRRTFICNALMLGIPPQIVMKWTGHSDYSSMKPYIDITDKAKANAMKLFDNL